MPEPATLDAPDQQAEPKVPEGIAGAMKEFADLTTPKPVAKPQESNDPAKGSEAASKAADAAKEPANQNPPDKGTGGKDIWEKAPEKLKNEYFKTKRLHDEAVGKISTYEKRIKEIESKPKEAPGDARLVEQLQKNISDLEQRLAGADYRQSKDYREKYQSRIEKTYTQSVAEIKQLQVKFTDKDGNESSRPATDADFQKLYYMQPADRDAAAFAMFGHSAFSVLDNIRQIARLSADAQEAESAHAKTIETRRAEEQSMSQRNTQRYQELTDTYRGELSQQWPDLFAPSEKDPEATEALNKGYEFVDKLIAGQEKMSLEDRAAYNAVLRARAAGFVRQGLEINRMKAENESLKTELKKYRRSDPGETELKANGAAAAGEDDGIPTGISDAAAKFLQTS